MAVTIHNLQVHLEIEGNDEEAAFARMFQKHIDRWCRAYEEQAQRRKYIERARRLVADDDGADQ